MTDLPTNGRRNRIAPLLAFLLAAMVLAGVWDLATDSPRVWRSAHAVVEVGLILLGAVSALLFGLGWQQAERSIESLRASLAGHEAERDRWRQLAHTALRGLGEAMDTQFDAWALTPAEKETALFTLKGYSHKETAKLTGRSERTVRQHAVSVYRKSGLAGRAELAAFFFEDMLLPSSEREAPAVDSSPRPG